MTEELYINGSLVDIESVDIVRRYFSPYFQDVNALMNDSSYTIKLPITQLNLAAFGYMTREDMNTSIPYDYLSCNYYVNGLPVIINGQARVLEVGQTIDIQITYGVNRNLYKPLFTRRLNDITTGGTITSDNWIVAWKQTAMFATGKKYKYLNYISGERESDVLDGGTRILPIPAPYTDHAKNMTWHPYISFNNILDLIIEDNNIQNPTSLINVNTFNSLKALLLDKGIILGGNKGYKLFEKTSILNHTINYGNQARIGLSSFSDGSFKINSTNNTFGLDPLAVPVNKQPLTIDFDITLQNFYDEDGGNIYPESPAYIEVLKSIDGTTWESYADIDYEIVEHVPGEYITTLVETSISIQAEYGELYAFALKGTTSGITSIQEGSFIKISHVVTNAIYYCSPSGTVGYYDCLLNLPDMTAMEFVQQMLILTGMGVSYDADGKMIFVSLEDLDLSESYDWTNKISSIQSGVFRFKDMAQRNRIAYSNSRDVNHEAEDFIDVRDFTLQEEKDMYILSFNMPDRNENGQAEFILYKQRVAETQTGTSFANQYSEKPSVAVYDNNGDAIVERIKPNTMSIKGVNIPGFIVNYNNYKKLADRPIVKDVEVNLDFFTTANIDMKKASYIGEWGKYAIILELNAPNKEVATAKLLLINQAL